MTQAITNTLLLKLRGLNKSQGHWLLSKKKKNILCISMKVDLAKIQTSINCWLVRIDFELQEFKLKMMT